MSGREALPGETPIEDFSGLRAAGIRTRADLNRWEARNIRKAVVEYLEAIKAADEGDYSPLRALPRKYTAEP